MAGGANSPEKYLSDTVLLRSMSESPDGIFVCDSVGTIVFANATACALTGYSANYLVGSKVEQLVPESTRSRHSQLRETYNQAPQGRPMGRGMVLHLVRADGVEVPVEISLSPVDSPEGRLTIALVRDIRERLADEARLLSTQEMLTLSNERERIARDLHDTVLQRLFGLGLELQALAMKLPPVETARVERAVDEIDLIIKEVRTSVFTLGAAQRAGSLGQELGNIIAQSARVLGFTPRLRIEGPVETSVTAALRPDLTATLREALANVARHSKATAASVDIAIESDQLSLTVTDNGIGLPDEGNAHAGNGMHNMQVRALGHRGYLLANSRPEGGTRLEWIVSVA